MHNTPCRRHGAWACALILALLTSALLTPAYGAPGASAEQLAAEARAQRMFETRAYLNDKVRLERIVYALLKAAGPYCIQNRKYTLGVPPVAATDLPADLRAGFIDTPESDASLPRFLYVAHVSPAWLAGIREGDQLLSITDSATGSKVASGWVFERPANTLATNATFKIEISNAAGTHTLETKPQLICEVLPHLVRHDELVARLTGSTMTVSTGLLRFANDDELALLLANELAHSILPHTVKTTTPSAAKHAVPYSPAEERYADYLGTYIAALGEFDVENAKNIWSRVAANPPSRVKGGIAYLHPPSAERAVWQRVVMAEIHRKNMTGLPLMPDRKSLPPNLHAEFAVTDDPFVADAQPPRSDEDSRLNRVADVPFINSDGRSGYQRFLNTPLRPRAFAIGRGKAGVGVWAYRGGSNAAVEALKSCASTGSPCYLYAVDERVVWNPETAERMPEPSTNDVDQRLNRIAEVPFLNSEGRSGYEHFLNITMRPRAFVIGPNGNGGAAWAYRSGPNASADALTYCAVLTRGRPCFVYAVDDRVVWDLPNAPISPQAPRVGSDNGGSVSRPPASGFADIHDLSAIPLPQEQLMSYRAFLEKPAPRAFVITQEGFGRYWLGPAAMDDALSYCERLGEPCWLYAIDDDVVWQADKTKRISRRVQLPKQSDELQFLK